MNGKKRLLRKATALVSKPEPEQAGKPSSVFSSHLSWIPVARYLQRPNPRSQRATSSPSYLVLLRVGFT